jgi:hypothetical protein
MAIGHRSLHKEVMQQTVTIAKQCKTSPALFEIFQGNRELERTAHWHHQSDASKIPMSGASA